MGTGPPSRQRRARRPNPMVNLARIIIYIWHYPENAPLRQNPYGGANCDNAPLIQEVEITAVGPCRMSPPAPYPSGLVSVHGGDRSCVVNQCRRLGISGPEGRHYCATHMKSAALPKPETPRRNSTAAAHTGQQPRPECITYRAMFCRPRRETCHGRSFRESTVVHRRTE